MFNSNGFNLLCVSIAIVLTNFLVFNMSLLGILFVRLILIKNNNIFKIKKLSLLMSMSLIKFFFLHFFKVPLLYTSYFLIYAFNWYGTFLNIEYNIGLDKLGVVFVFLTVFLIPSSLLISWKSVSYNIKQFFLLFLILELLLINVFCAIDLMLFYIAFESI